MHIIKPKFNENRLKPWAVTSVQKQTEKRKGQRQTETRSSIGPVIKLEDGLARVNLLT